MICLEGEVSFNGHLESVLHPTVDIVHVVLVNCPHKETVYEYVSMYINRCGRQVGRLSRSDLQDSRTCKCN